MSSSADILKKIKDEEIEYLDLRFTDPRGKLQHVSILGDGVDEDLLDDGWMFDGSSIAGWKSIDQSDMKLVPDCSSSYVDPFYAEKTLCIHCNVAEPDTGELYNRDPRSTAVKAESYLKSSGIGDTSYFGPEAEFFIFDDIRFDQTPSEAFFYIDSIEGQWNRGTDSRAKGEGPNLGYKLRHKEGYFPVPPAAQMMDIRNEMMQTMIDIGLNVECQHHEVGTAGQSEIDLKFDDLVRMGDALCMYKYVIKNVAARHGKTVTFMPKPIFSDNGSGMHTHISLWKDGNPIFAGSGYAGLSDEALFAIGGILKHAPALLAFTNPTTNSYKRLVPGYEAPVNLAYSQRNRSASCRIPM